MTDLRDLLREARRELTDLIGQIDAATIPRPDVINPPDHAVPGPEWQPVKGYTIRAWQPAAGEEALPECVYVIWPDAQWSGDMDAVRTHEARRIATALLAAADWADQHSAGIVHLPNTEVPRI